MASCSVSRSQHSSTSTSLCLRVLCSASATTAGTTSDATTADAASDHGSTGSTNPVLSCSCSNAVRSPTSDATHAAYATHAIHASLHVKWARINASSSSSPRPNDHRRTHHYETTATLESRTISSFLSKLFSPSCILYYYNIGKTFRHLVYFPFEAMAGQTSHVGQELMWWRSTATAKATRDGRIGNPPQRKHCDVPIREIFDVAEQWQKKQTMITHRNSQDSDIIQYNDHKTRRAQE